MSSKLKSKSNVSKESPSELQAGGTESASGNAALEEKIRRRAYEIYLERGEQPGSDLDDWFQAERELEAKVLAQAS
jgi:hypothetical protein